MNDEGKHKARGQRDVKVGEREQKGDARRVLFLDILIRDDLNTYVSP